MSDVKFLLVASYADSLINFRGPLIRSLQEKQLVVHVAAPGVGHNSEVRSILECQGVVVHDIPMQRTGLNPIADLRTLFILWRLMLSIRPKYLLTYTIKPVVYGSIAGALAFIPKRFALITGLGYAFQSKKFDGIITRLIGILSRFLYFLALRTTSAVFLQNRDDEQLLRSLGIVGKRKRTIVVNGSGIDLDYFAFTPVSSDRPKFLLVARLLGAKGVREYVDAARRVKVNAPGAVFALAGWIDDDNPDSILETELNEWIEEGTVHFLGKLDDVRPALAECTVYVLPSYREGTPRTVLEAMAVGRAVITTDAPGCRETVEEGRNGFLVPVASVEDLAAAMQCFIDQPSLNVMMGAESRRLVKARYDVHKVNAMMLENMGIQLGSDDQ